MAEARSSLRRRRIAFVLAFVLALLGVAFLGWSISQHQDARADLADARRALVARRAETSGDARVLRRAQDAVGAVDSQLTGLGAGVTGIADMDQRDLEAVRAAIQAGLAGSLADYNAAVDRRSALDPQHDAALEQLRQQANAAIVALDGLG